MKPFPVSYLRLWVEVGGEMNVEVQKRRGSKKEKRCTELRWQQRAERQDVLCSVSQSGREPQHQTDRNRVWWSYPREFRHFLCSLYTFISICSCYLPLHLMCLSVMLFTAPFTLQLYNHLSAVFDWKDRLGCKNLKEFGATWELKRRTVRKNITRE